MLISKLEPRQLASYFSNSASYSKSDIDEINAAPSRSERVSNLLSFIERGDSNVVEEFVPALNKAGYCDLASLLNPDDFHRKAGESISIEYF